jgi:hypothetical protein
MTTPTATHYHVVAGLSEGINLPTLSDAQYLADGQAALGILPVRVFAVLQDGTHVEV